jgi:hypothetical protein
LRIRTCVPSTNRRLTARHQYIRTVRIVLFFRFPSLSPYHVSKDHEHCPGPTISELPGTRGAHCHVLAIAEPNPPPNETAAKYPRGGTRKSNSIMFCSPNSHASLFGEMASITYSYGASCNAGSQKIPSSGPGRQTEYTQSSIRVQAPNCISELHRSPECFPKSLGCHLQGSCCDPQRVTDEA